MRGGIKKFARGLFGTKNRIIFAVSTKLKDMIEVKLTKEEEELIAAIRNYNSSCFNRKLLDYVYQALGDVLRQPDDE